MYCQECGSTLLPNSLFCGDCGAKTETESIKSNFSGPVQVLSEPIIIDPVPIAMKHCRNCGNAVSKDAFACMNCGLKPENGHNNCQSCGASTHSEAVVCVKCGVLLESKEKNALIPKSQIQAVQENAPPIQQYQPQQTNNYQQNITIIAKEKSMGTAIVLTFLFGPLGLFYATIIGGLIMTLASLLLFFAVPIVGPFLVWLGSIIWAAAAVGTENQKIRDSYIQRY